MFNPGVLERTPIAGVPLPMYYASYAGSPWLDLAVMGMADPAAARADAGYRVKMFADSLGLPNESEPDQVDVLIVGDSFAVMASDREPPGGLQDRLERETGLSVYNLGVSAIGPSREAWLLDHVGLPKQPSIVLWLFYAGNDAFDANAVKTYQDAGITTYAGLYPDYRRPWLFSLDVFRGFWSRASWPDWLDPIAKARAGEANAALPLPGLRIRSDSPADARIWFHPFSLRYLLRTPDDWMQDPGWQISREVIAAARDRVEAAGARFIAVYLPTKPEVYLPWVEPEPEQLHRMATYDFAGHALETDPPTRPLELSPDEFLQRALAHRESLRGLFEAFCAAESLECVIASDPLEALARGGRSAYLSADTHWNREGQNAVAVALIERLSRPER
jgi:hypothetical protein